MMPQATQPNRDTGVIAYFGVPLGEYSTSVKDGVIVTEIKAQGKTLTAAGTYCDCKQDRLAGILFIELAYNDRTFVVCMDIAGESTELCENFNKLYMRAMFENYDVSVEINDSLIIAYNKSGQAMVDRLEFHPACIIIHGFGEEKLVVWKPGTTLEEVQAYAHGEVVNLATPRSEVFEVPAVPSLSNQTSQTITPDLKQAAPILGRRGVHVGMQAPTSAEMAAARATQADAVEAEEYSNHTSVFGGGPVD